MLSLGLLFVAEAACIALGVAHARRVRRLFGDDLRALVSEVARLPVSERSQRARQRARSPEEVARLIADAADEEDPALRAAEVDGVLADVAIRLDAASGWTTTALRGAVVLGALHAFWIQGTLGAIGLVTGLTVGGVLGAMLRKTRRTEQEGRAAIDALVNALLGLGHRATIKRDGRDGRRAPPGSEGRSVSSGETFRVPYRELRIDHAVLPPFDPPCGTRAKALPRRGETR